MSKLVVSDDSDNELMISETLIDKASKKHLVPKLCETRWTARVNTLSALIAKSELSFSPRDFRILLHFFLSG
jgi:hypothetical protein